MLNVKYIEWEKYEQSLKLSKLTKYYPKKDIEEAILSYGARVKVISDKKFIVLGKTNMRDYIFSVVHYLKKYTIYPTFVRPMNESEREHYEKYQLYPY